MRRLSLAGRKELAKLIFVLLCVLGAVQSVLLAEGIGTSDSIRYGCGVPLTLAVVLAGVAWVAFARRLRNQSQDKLATETVSVP